MRPRTVALLLAAALIALPLVMSVSAAPVPPVNPPPLPSSFYGTLKLPSGANLPNGTLVSARIGSVRVAESASFKSDADSVYRIDVPGDFPDTATVEGGREGQTITFEVGGVPVQSAVWHSTTYVRQDLVAGPSIATPQAAFTASKGRNVAGAGDGATLAAFSSQFDSQGNAAANVIDGASSGIWTSAFGQTTNQFVKVQLAESPQVIQQVVLKTAGGRNDPRDIQIRVSTTISDDAAFDTVLTTQYPQNTTDATFAIGPVAARFLELLVVDNWGDNGTTSVAKLQVLTADRQGGIVSWPFGPPASVVASSGSTPDNAIDDSLTSTWTSLCCSSSTFLKVQLGGGRTYPIDRVRLMNISASGVKDFEVRVSNSTADDAAFTPVFSGTAADDGSRLQEFSFAPVQARFVELVVTSSYGSLLQVGAVQAITPDGANAARFGGVGAFVVDSSGRFGPQTQFDPANAIDADVNTAWFGAAGQPNNQWIKVLLTENAAYAVDRVKLVGTSSNDGVKDFSIRVSNTTSADSAFIAVLTATLPQDAREHWYSFQPMTAKYVELFVTNNYGAPDHVRVPDFEVFSPQRGGASVPFVDLSTEPGGSIVAWNWSFGDGATSTAQYPLHSYSAPGTFPVQLTVTDAAGHTGSASSTYTVQPPLVPSFTWSPLTPSEGAGAATVFTDTSGGLVTSREWSAPGALVDGETNAATLRLSFPDNGTFPVTLSVTDQNQVSASVTQQVTVLNVPPTVTLPTTFYAVGGQPTQFGSLSAVFDPGQAEGLVCQWDFGDGSTSDFDATNCTTLNHTYAAPPTGVRATYAVRHSPPETKTAGSAAARRTSSSAIRLRSRKSPPARSPRLASTITNRPIACCSRSISAPGCRTTSIWFHQTARGPSSLRSVDSPTRCT